MRLTSGTVAPEFTAASVRGSRVSLDNLRGGAVLLKFYRFAACPICNLHLRELSLRHDELAAAGLTVVVLYHSPLERIEREQGHALPFELVADPDKRIFEAYGVEASLKGMFSRAVARDYVRAMGAGHFSRPLGHEGGIQGHPADFLVGPDGVIRYVHYGSDYADTLRVDAILQAAREHLTTISEYGEHAVRESIGREHDASTWRDRARLPG
ncbi:MAG: AhpC/TSA family protein [Acidobacteriota bacterium]|nr:AhpC/TSA family protein [Acidobacteriota bacterium]